MCTQIRDFEYSPESHESRKQELDKLMQDQESLRGSLLQWCYTSYGEVLFIYLSLILICRKIQEYYRAEFTGNGRNQGDYGNKYVQLNDYLLTGI